MFNRKRGRNELGRMSVLRHKAVLQSKCFHITKGGGEVKAPLLVTSFRFLSDLDNQN